MASPLLRHSHSNYDIIERVVNDRDVSECDSGVFSENSQQFPYYVSRYGNNSCRNSRLTLAYPGTPCRRLIQKNGRNNLIRTKIPSLWTAYIRDVGNTLVNSRWRWTILCFASSHIISWLLFAWFYMLTANDNEDLANSKAPCLIGISGFAGYFLFSLETQHTIGYGTRYLTSNCPETIFLLALQMIMDVAICGGMASIVYTKMIRPRSVHTTSLFSKTALICQRDGVLCLIFRVRDDGNKHMVGTQIKAHLIETNNENLHLQSLHLEKPGFLIWPLEIVHKITAKSPFWNNSAKDLISKRFELIVSLEGGSATTGQCSKIRTSYLSSEILWGHRFKPCVMFDNVKQTYYVNDIDFNTTEEVATPLCSAQRLDEVVQDFNTPILRHAFVGSPSVSLRMRNEDLESLTTSSGIGSWREELLTPILLSPSRKLSIIREYRSAENLIGGEQFIEIHDTDLVLEKTKSSSDLDDFIVNQQLYTMRKENSLVVPKNERKEELDVEKLLANLQSYLEENEGLLQSNTRGFHETNL